MQRQANINEERLIKRFSLGETYITPGAEEALMTAGQTPIEFLRRHMSLEPGELSDDDVRENEFSVRDGFRVLTAYRTANARDLIWIITEADRSSTTVLLAAEY